MKDRFAEMDCFVLTRSRSNPVRDFESKDGMTRLEKGYRRYAALFEKVKLVLKRDQAVERYLNYPHVCDDDPEDAVLVSVKAALEQAESDPVFIGTSELDDFPLELAVELVRNYRGEAFLGYRLPDEPTRSQPLFGLFSRRLVERMKKMAAEDKDLAAFLQSEGRFLPLADREAAGRIGLN